MFLNKHVVIGPNIPHYDFIMKDVFLTYKYQCENRWGPESGDVYVVANDDVRAMSPAYIRICFWQSFRTNLVDVYKEIVFHSMTPKNSTCFLLLLIASGRVWRNEPFACVTASDLYVTPRIVPPSVSYDSPRSV